MQVDAADKNDCIMPTGNGDGTAPAPAVAALNEVFAELTMVNGDAYADTEPTGINFAGTTTPCGLPQEGKLGQRTGGEWNGRRKRNGEFDPGIA